MTLISEARATPAASARRIVIVGASLAGLRAGEALRAEGFAGSLTMIGDEPCAPYDRPPLSKGVLAGRLPADHTTRPSGSLVCQPWDWTWLAARFSSPTIGDAASTAC